MSENPVLHTTGSFEVELRKLLRDLANHKNKDGPYVKANLALRVQLLHAEAQQTPGVLTEDVMRQLCTETPDMRATMFTMFCLVATSALQE